MTIAEYNQKLEKFSQGLSLNIFKKVASYASADIRSEVENRVEQTQTDANGAKFSRYSTKPILTSGNTAKSKNIWTKLAGSKSKRKELDWVTIQKGGKNIHLFELPGGYAELRRLEGFSNPNKSFEFTGVMWNQWGIRDQIAWIDGFRVRMGGLTEYSQDLINIHSDKEEIAIIDMNDKEREALHDRVDQWVLKFAKECGL